MIENQEWPKTGDLCFTEKPAVDEFEILDFPQASATMRLAQRGVSRSWIKSWIPIVFNETILETELTNFLIITKMLISIMHKKHAKIVSNIKNH